MDERTADTGQEPFARAMFLTAREAAIELGVNERTIRRAIDRGELRAAKLSGVIRIRVALRSLGTAGVALLGALGLRTEDNAGGRRLPVRIAFMT